MRRLNDDVVVKGCKGAQKEKLREEMVEKKKEWAESDETMWKLVCLSGEWVGESKNCSVVPSSEWLERWKRGLVGEMVGEKECGWKDERGE